MVENKDFGHLRKWILTYQLYNTVVLDQFSIPTWSGCDNWSRPYFSEYITDRFFFQLQLKKGGRGLEVVPHSWLWAGMVASHLCNFCEILSCWRWVWWGVLLEFAETKNNFSACNAKKKGWQSQKLMLLCLQPWEHCGGVGLVSMASTVCQTYRSEVLQILALFWWLPASWAGEVFSVHSINITI